MAEGPELQLLLTCGRLFLGTAEDEEALTLLRLPLNWASLLKKAEEEGMSGLLAFQLRRLARTYNLDLPLDSFTQALHHIFAHNGALFAELSALHEEFRQRGLQAILLKGGALIETVYRSHLGLRPLSDLDLLVKASDLPAFTEILLKRGFRPLAPSSTFFMNGSAAIDLHTDLVGATRIRRRTLAFQFDPETLWREATPPLPSPLKGGGEGSHDPTLLILSPPHQFLHVVVHALKHSFSRLIWFVDLGLVLQGARINPAPTAVGEGLRPSPWEELLSWAEVTGSLRALAYALFGLSRLMRVSAPQEVLARLPQLNWIEQTFLNRVVSRQAMETLGEVMVAFSIPDLQGKLGYFLELGFPRHEVLAEVFPSTPSWLRYPRRLLQVMALEFQEGRNIVPLVKRRDGS